jgi:hypothetical protein
MRRWKKREIEHHCRIRRPAPLLVCAVLRCKLIGEGFAIDVDAYPDR